MTTYEQIRNPLTNRYITVYGKTYYDLIDNEYYDEDYLLSLPRVNVIKPSHQNLFDLTGIDDTDALILNQLDDQSLVRACQTNQRLKKLCQSRSFLQNRIDNYLFQFKKEFITMKYRIARAIIAEKNTQGSTLVYIKKYLEANYKINPTNPWIKRTINILTSSNSGERLIINNKLKGHYKVSPELKEAVKYL